mmetsp:Transcript_9226/g.13584  ORF Transcript_9226/g.13584 Transcript_9226/m.13584 type:complete len:264 (-) Transcript_9226:301-1092(-)
MLLVFAHTILVSSHILHRCNHVLDIGVITLFRTLQLRHIVGLLKLFEFRSHLRQHEANVFVPKFLPQVVVFTQNQQVVTIFFALRFHVVRQGAQLPSDLEQVIAHGLIGVLVHNRSNWVDGAVQDEQGTSVPTRGAFPSLELRDLLLHVCFYEVSEPFANPVFGITDVREFFESEKDRHELARRFLKLCGKNISLVGVEVLEHAGGLAKSEQVAFVSDEVYIDLFKSFQAGDEALCGADHFHVGRGYSPGEEEVNVGVLGFFI